MAKMNPTLITCVVLFLDRVWFSPGMLLRMTLNSWSPPASTSPKLGLQPWIITLYVVLGIRTQDFILQHGLALYHSTEVLAPNLVNVLKQFFGSPHLKCFYTLYVCCAIIPLEARRERPIWNWSCWVQFLATWILGLHHVWLKFWDLT